MKPYTLKEYLRCQKIVFSFYPFISELKNDKQIILVERWLECERRMDYYESFFADRAVGDERDRVLKYQFCHFKIGKGRSILN